MIKNIIFDMGGVLIEWNPKEFIKRRNITNELDADILLKRVYNSDIWSEHDRGTYKGKDFEEAIVNNVPEHLKEEASWIVNNWPTLSSRIEGMMDLLKELKDKGYHLYLLSNAGYDQPTYFKNYGYNQYFDGQFVSAFHGVRKPEPLIFEELLKEYSLSKEECLFIDDMQMNVDASKKIGIDAYLFKDAKDLRHELMKREIIAI